MTDRPSGEWPHLTKRRPAQTEICNRAEFQVSQSNLARNVINSKKNASKICKNCAWFATGEMLGQELSSTFDYLDRGECRAAPPAISSGKLTCGLAVWPVTWPDRWCAAWTLTQGDHR